MKKLVSLLLTLAMLLSMVSVMAAEDKAEPTLTYPKMTAALSDEGVMTVTFDTDVKNYDVNVEITDGEGSWTWRYPSYDAEKKAYVANIGAEYADWTIDGVWVYNNKREDGKIDNHGYSYAADGKINNVTATTGTYKTDSDAKTETTVTSSREENYEDGVFDGYRLEEETDVYSWTDDGSKRDEKLEYKDYDKDGILTKSGVRTRAYSYKYKDDDKEYDYHQADEYKEDFTKNNEFGNKFITGTRVNGEKHDHNTDKEKGIYTDSDTSEYREEKAYNKNGALVGTYVYNMSSSDSNTSGTQQKTSNYQEEQMYYDAFGNLTHGYSTTSTNANHTYKEYSNGALSYTDETEYKLEDDGSQGDRIKETTTRYRNTGYGTSSVSEVYVRTPNEKEYTDADGNKQTAYLNDSTVDTYYDADGGVTSVREYSQDYTYSADEKADIRTTTTTNYVGAVSDAELKDKTVETRKNYTNGDYKYTTVKTDYAGKVISETETSRIVTPATETTKYKRVETSTSYGPGGNTKTVSTYTYDDDGHNLNTTVTTNAKGKVTQERKYAWDKEETKYITTTTYNNEDGELVGTRYYKRIDGGDVTNYYDKSGKLVYKDTWTNGKYVDGVWKPGSRSYTDADGNEIGYYRTDDKGQISEKEPLLDESTFTLNGWTEYTTQNQEDAEGKKYIKSESKTYNKAGYLTYDYVSDGMAGKNTTTYFSLYDENGTLYNEESVTKDGATSWTTTYNQNPNYVKSKVVTRPADKLEKDSEERVTKRVSSSTTEYFDLAGKADRSEETTTTTTYTYDEDGYSSTTATVTQWKDASGNAVVTKTTNPSAKSGENSVEYKKADGTLIGYEKHTDNTDKSYVNETVSANFNPYTGFVRSSSRKTWTYDKDDEQTSYTSQSFNAAGELTDEETWEKTENGEKRSEKHYYEQEDGSLKLGWDNVSETNDKEGTDTWTGHGYYQSGKVSRTWEGTDTYDKEKDVWVHKSVNKDADGNITYVEEGTTEILASEYTATGSYWWDGQYDTVAVYDWTYTDGEGNVVGYKKTDDKGTVTEKIPYRADGNNGDETTVTVTGKPNPGWKETVTDVRGNVLSKKIYNAKGQLMSESTSELGKSSDTSYWKYTGEMSDSEERVTAKGITTTTTKYYNEDGSLRKTVVDEEGRATGTHIYTNKTTVSDASGAVVYTYEYTRNAQTGAEAGVYKDAAGNEIGHVTFDEEGEPISELYPRTGERTGKLLGFSLYETDENGVYTQKSYDANMNELSATTSYSEKGKDEDGYATTSYYLNGNETPWKVETFYPGNAGYGGGFTGIALFNTTGDPIAATIDKSYSQGLTQNETQYYNQDGELVYSRLSMKDYNNQYGGYNEYTLYLDAKGNEIGRVKTEDNGDSVYKVPQTTIGNNITGYTEELKSEDGTVTITRKYDRDNKLTGERYRKEDVVLTDDQITTTFSTKDGTVVDKRIEDLDEDLYTTRTRMISYSPWNGRYMGEEIDYPATDDYRWPATKRYDENGNLVLYGWAWDENDYEMRDFYWVNGQQQEYYWYDTLYENGYHDEEYNPDGSYYNWVDSDGNGTYRRWWYGDDGILNTLEERTPDGKTNYTYYDRDGNIRGYDWGITTTYDWGWTGYADGQNNSRMYTQQSVVWDANKAIYDKYVEPDPEGTTIETWADYAGNVKVMKDSGTTVTLTNAANGWHQAFGNEWYYVENGELATGWKLVDGTWYYFNDSGKMATGLVKEKDGAPVYTLDSTGAWVSGWSEDEYGNKAYSGADGVAVTGWQQIGGKWYYFDEGWTLNEDAYYDDNLGWVERKGGTMVTGAAKIWVNGWTDQMTYFFNADGTWDTTPGWKTDGIDVYYFEKGGNRVTGWKKIGGDWFYFNEKGIMRNGWVGAGSSWYYMNDTDGFMVENAWVQEMFENDWYYMDNDGLMVTGWKQIDGVWYYFADNGKMASEEWVPSGSDWYFMGESGAMATGWVKDGTKWYYMKEDGTMFTGWLDTGSAWYYLGSDGAMVTGQVTIDGVVSNFAPTGEWLGYAE